MTFIPLARLSCHTQTLTQTVLVFCRQVWLYPQPWVTSSRADQVNKWPLGHVGWRCAHVFLCVWVHSSECIENTIKRDTKECKCEAKTGTRGCLILENDRNVVWNNNLLVFSTVFNIQSGRFFSSLTFHATKTTEKSQNIFYFFWIYEAAFALISSDTRCEGKNIPRKFLFGFPDNQPWYCVIMAGLLRGVQSLSAGPRTMVTVWCSVCGLSLLLMKETQQQLPSFTLFRFSCLRSQENIHHQRAF